MSNGGGVYRSSDKGLTWTHLISDMFVISVWGLEINQMGLFAATSKGTYFSANHGMKWVPVISGLTDTDTRCLTTCVSTIFVSTYSGIFSSASAGAKWTLVSTELGNVPNTYGIAVHGAYLYAGTVRGELYRRELSDLVVVVDRPYKTAVEGYYLEQNYPNPFNPATTIAFTLPKRSMVSLSIFDMAGRKVADLVSQELAPGRHQKVWRAEGLPSGTYICRLLADSYIETKKFCLIK